MKNFGSRIAILVVLFIFAIYYAVPWTAFGVNLPLSWPDYKLGLDLQGWVELDYKVDLEEAKKDPDYSIAKEKEIVEWLKRIIDKRVQALNINDSIISSASYGNEKHIIVQIPLKGKSREENDANIQRAKNAIGKVVKIEFRELRDEVTEEDIQARATLADESLAEFTESEYDFFVTANKIKDNNDNVRVGTLTGTTDELAEYFIVPETSEWIIPNVISWTWVSDANFNIEWLEGFDLSGASGTGYYILENISDTSSYDTYNYAFIESDPSSWKAAEDEQWRVLNDQYFLKSTVQYTEAGTPMIELSFNNEWAQIFWELSTRLVGQPIWIFVWWELLTSPNVNEPILNGRAMITGQYSVEEASRLSNDINTWVVPAAIYLTSERSIDSKLWANSLDKLFVAWITWLFIIFMFLVYIYRWAGVLAGITLVIYLLLVLAIVKIFGWVLTLASVAGLILSIGIAIDANILIFERIKDELSKKHSKLQTAINKWFDNSWSAIWDSNLTGLIVSLILYVFGINIIKWFGLMLGIGIVVSLFSAMYVSRLFINLLARNEKIDLMHFIGKK